MAVVPGNQELDLKALAAAAGEKETELVPVKELQALTGYIRGGVTALAAKRDYPVYVDETIELFETVSISAGMRGLQILIAPADYLRATKGRIAVLGSRRSEPTRFPVQTGKQAETRLDIVRLDNGEME